MSETFQINPAVRTATIPLLGMAGPTGSGKTKSALLLALGLLLPGGKIVIVDTEAGRALEYAPDGEGKRAPELEDLELFHLPLDAPYRADRYLDAYRASAEYATPNGVVIIDSISHEHEGPGGRLEWHVDETERLSESYGTKAKASFAAWAKPSAARNALIRGLTVEITVPTIITFRTREKNVMITTGKRTEIVNQGESPIGAERLCYECTVFMLFERDEPKKPSRAGYPTFAFKTLHDTLEAENVFSRRSSEDCERITRETGERLRKWAGGGSSPAAPTEVAETYTVMSPEGTEYVRTLSGYLKNWNALVLKCKQADDMTSLREWHRTNAKAMANYATDAPGIADLQMVIEDALNAPADDPGDTQPTEHPEEKDEAT